MLLRWNLTLELLECGIDTFNCLCRVRNELNGRRTIDEPCVFTENKDGSTGVPYMPRRFPKGTWTVLAILPKTEPYEAPCFISTDACQMVDVWTSEHGHYGVKTGKTVMDYGYGLHSSTSMTTLGCGKILMPRDRIALVAAIEAAWAAKDTVKLEVY